MERTRTSEAQAPASESQQPAPQTTVSSAAPTVDQSPPVTGGEGSSAPAPGNQPNEGTAGTPAQGTPPSNSSTPTSSGSKGGSTPETTTTSKPETLTTAEPVELPALQEAQFTGPVVPKEELREETPVALTTAHSSDEDNATVAAAVAAAVKDRGNSQNDDHSDHPKGDKPDQHPQGNSGGMQCDNQRRPGQCDWNNNWWHDNKGQPVISNPSLNIDILVQICDLNTGQLYTVRVAAGSQRTIDTPGAGNYTFVVVEVNAPSVSVGVNVGVGMFNSAGPCGQHCSIPNRPSLNLSVRVNVQVGNVVYPRDVHAYGCRDDCRPIRVENDREYYRYFFDGCNPVDGYWRDGKPFQNGASFVPTEWRPPASPTVVPVTQQNLAEVLGTGEHEPLGGDPSQNVAAPRLVNDHGRLIAFLAIGLVIIGIGFACGYIRWQRRSA